MNEAFPNPPSPSAAGDAITPNAVDVADIILAAAVQHGAAAVWVEPTDAAEHGDSHRVSLERGRREIASAVLGGGLGDAVIARLSLLCDLDLLDRSTQTGRMTVRLDEATVDLILTTRHSSRGLRAEIRVLSDIDSVDEETIFLDDVDYPERLDDGTTIGPYLVTGRLGQGGMGVVYRVEHTMLGRAFAMKVLRSDLMSSDPDSALRFMREARAAARIHADGIVAVSDYGRLPDGRPYLVMELLDGLSVSELIERDGALEPRRAIAIARDAARSLQAAHDAGVVHRDLTPSNVFLHRTPQGERVKLVDFGAAHTVDPQTCDVPDGPPGIVLGTPYYMAPEQARGKETDGRSDLYGLGVVLFEMITGKVPFDGDSVRAIVRKHIFDAPPTPQSPHGAIPEELERIILRCLHKEPEQRFQRAEELADALDRVEEAMDRKGWRKWLP